VIQIFLTSKSFPSSLQENNTDQEYYDTPADQKFENILSIQVLLSCFSKGAAKLGVPEYFLKIFSLICNDFILDDDANNNNSSSSSPALAFGSSEMVGIIINYCLKPFCEEDAWQDEDRLDPFREEDEDADVLDGKAPERKRRIFVCAAAAIEQIIKAYPSASSTVPKLASANYSKYYDQYESLGFVSSSAALRFLLRGLKILTKTNGKENNNNNGIYEDGVAQVVATISLICQRLRAQDMILIRTAETGLADGGAFLVDGLFDVVEKMKDEKVKKSASSTVEQIITTLTEECVLSNQENEMKKTFLEPVLKMKQNRRK
jgi:hypothetical protein